MRTQQEAERAEQQRIKNLVLNYDLRDENESDGEYANSLTPNLNKHQHTRQQRGQRNNGNPQASNNFTSPINTNNFHPQQKMNDSAKTLFDDQGGLEKQHNPYNVPRIDKASNNRSTQRARKLQLSDVDWYDNTNSNPSNASTKQSSPLPKGGFRKNGQPRKTRGDRQG